LELVILTLWKVRNRLEELKVPLELRFITIRLYENVIAKFRNTKHWLEETDCNIGVKKGCRLSPTLFDISIKKLEGFSMEVGCIRMTLDEIVTILLLYANDIVLMVRCPFDLNKQLKIL
jgi:hypothetical protein